MRRRVSDRPAASIDQSNLSPIKACRNWSSAAQGSIQQTRLTPFDPPQFCAPVDHGPVRGVNCTSAKELSQSKRAQRPNNCIDDSLSRVTPTINWLLDPFATQHTLTHSSSPHPRIASNLRVFTPKPSNNEQQTTNKQTNNSFDSLIAQLLQATTHQATTQTTSQNKCLVCICQSLIRSQAAETKIG